MIKYKRVLLKLSGEVLAGDDGFGLNRKRIDELCGEIAEVVAAGVSIAVVVGGGNIYRGALAADSGRDRVQSDYMGMLATVINSLALQNALENLGVSVRVQTAINMGPIAEPFIRRRAVKHLDKGRIVIFAAGTGLPFFSTDTAAAFRASEINADCLLKATKVDGIYERDPVKFPDAKFLPNLSYRDFLDMRLSVMDTSAVMFCESNSMRIVVFDVRTSGNLGRLLVNGENIGSTVS
ncbi:MAG: UMP kinase [Synergistaceae bacterium]|nr:UMP kinase [Synergistaceae bacterium]